MMANSQMEVAVIGAGPAGLMAAEVLAQAGAPVTVYDAMPSAGRKFLMAGRGGLNLKHSEELPGFLARSRGARVERSAGAADLCRLQRSGFPRSVQGVAAAAGVAAATRLDGRAVRDAP